MGEAPLQARESDAVKPMESYMTISFLLYYFLAQIHYRITEGIAWLWRIKLCFPLYADDSTLWKDFYYIRYFPGCAAHVVL